VKFKFRRNPEESWDGAYKRMEDLGRVKNAEGGLLAALAGWRGVSEKIHPEWRKIDRMILKVIGIMERDRRRR
jgi:hypothetical protein